jgi:hypothetical protein
MLERKKVNLKITEKEDVPLLVRWFNYAGNRASSSSVKE